LGAARTGSVDSAQVALRDLEATEAAQFMASGEQPCPEYDVSQRLLRLARTPTLVCGSLTHPNRRMRTRTYGGVAGASGRPLPPMPIVSFPLGFWSPGIKVLATRVSGSAIHA